MLRKIRRGNSKEEGLRGGGGGRPTDSPSPPPLASTESTATQPRQGMGFFDLPAELRNAIYEHIMSGSTLTLDPTVAFFPQSRWLKLRRPRKDKTTVPKPINGLLLASRQSRREYMSVLLSTVPVIVVVEDLNFGPLIRAGPRLGQANVGVLRANPSLTIALDTQNCTDKCLDVLRRWLEYRRDCPDDGASLPWSYEFPLDRLLPPTMMGRIRLMREVSYYLDLLGIVEKELDDDARRRELRLIIAAFECKVGWLEQDVGLQGLRTLTVTRNARGLPGGGLR